MGDIREEVGQCDQDICVYQSALWTLGSCLPTKLTEKVISPSVITFQGNNIQAEKDVPLL
jgi:hypothetical protein